MTTSLSQNVNLNISNSNGQSASLGYSSMATSAIFTSNPALLAQVFQVNITCNNTINCNGNGNCSLVKSAPVCTCISGFFGSSCQYNQSTFYQTQYQLSSGLYQLNQLNSYSSNPLSNVQSLIALTSVGFADVFSDNMLILASNISQSLSSVNPYTISSSYYSAVIGAQSNLLGIASVSANATVVGKSFALSLVPSTLNTLNNLLSQIVQNNTGFSFSSNLVSSTVQSLNSSSAIGRRLLQSTNATSIPQPGVIYPSWLTNTYTGQIIISSVTGYITNPYALASNISSIISQIVSISLYNQLLNVSITTVPNSQGEIEVYLPKLLNTDSLQFLSNSTMPNYYCLQWNASGNTWTNSTVFYTTMNSTHFTCTAQNLGIYAVQLNLDDLNNITITNNSNSSTPTAPTGNNVKFISIYHVNIILRLQDLAKSQFSS